MRKETIILQFAVFLFFLFGCNRIQPLEDSLNSAESASALNLENENYIHSDELLCGTNNKVPNQAFEKSLGTFSLMALQSNTYCIRVAFFIVTKDDGSGGFNSDEIPQIMQNLNEAYNPHNVFLYNEGVHYIKNTSYYDLSISSSNNKFPNLIASNNSASAISFYLVNKVFDGATQYSGVAESIPSKNLAVANSMALTPTSAHEVGHCLNLFHTHRGTGEGGCNENIDGSNCSSCGDYVCDTPADPRLGSHNLSSCIYTGGGGYNPIVSNLMSYSGYCRDNFTNGQGNRMLSALSSSSTLQPIINSNCSVPTLSGASSICNSAVYTLSTLPANTTVTWDVKPSGVVTLSNQTSNSVTVQVNTSQAINISLIARIHYTDGNRINIHKRIDLTGSDLPNLALDQPAMQCLSMNSNRYFSAGYSTSSGFQNIGNHPSVSEIDWQVLEYSSSSPTPITNFSKHSNSVINSSISISIPYKSNDYVITIVPRAKSKCGGAWGSWGPGYAYMVKRSCTSAVYALDVRYSPSDQRYTLSFSESYRNVRKIISANLSMRSQISNNYDIHIYDNNYKEVYSKKQLNESEIIVPKLSSGKYMVELLQDGYIYKQDLDIK